MITLERLTKRYEATTAVDDVSMIVEPHTITTVVGTSGSGKSTLLRMINRLVEPTSGRVLIDGIDTATEPAHLLRRRIGYAIQGLGLFPHRTVAENIATVPRLLGWDAARVRRRVDELLAAFELDPARYADVYPHELSGGEQQRVGVARALAAEPNLLLMDEPFGALDPILRGKAQDDLLDIQRRFGTTIILVTHDIDEAFRLGHRVAVMSGGRLLQHDRPARLVTHPADPFVSQLVGATERALRLLALTPAHEIARPGVVEGPTLPGTATLRELLDALVWSGAAAANVADGAGAADRHVTLGAVLAHGRRAGE
ncbi:MAG TPA: ABC transporter ATP-binding protein [Steroidobacteraceae bacterium]|nr:ABC transporter ATP-binding protein [Steroidobacteraceae bacterium]